MKLRKLVCSFSLFLTLALYGFGQEELAPGQKTASPVPQPATPASPALPATNSETTVAPTTTTVTTPATAKSTTPSSKGKLLGYVKIGPLPTVLNKYLKFLETVSPNTSSSFALMTMGALGGPDCPGISAKDNIGVFLFPNLQNKCSIVVLFKAQPNAHVVKILNGLQQLVFERVERGWYFLCDDATVAKGVRVTVGKLIQFLESPQSSDLNVQVFDGFWNEDNNDNSVVKADVAKQFDFYAMLKPFIEEIAGLGFSVTLDNPTVRLSFDIKSKPNTALSTYLSKPLISAPVKAAQWLPKNSISQGIGKCEFNDTVEYFHAISTRASENIKNTPTLPGNPWKTLVDFIISKSSFVEQYLSLCAKYCDGYWASRDWLSYTNKKELKGRTVCVYTGQWTTEEGKKFFNSLFKESIPQWTAELITLLEKVKDEKHPKNEQGVVGEQVNDASNQLLTSLVQILKAVKYDYKENVFEKEGVSVNWASVSCSTPQPETAKKAGETASTTEAIKSNIAFDEQVFLAIANGNILYTSTQEDMEALITAVMAKNEGVTPVTDVVLPAGYLMKGEADLKAMLETFSKDMLTASSTPPIEPSKINFSVEKQPNQLILKADGDLQKLMQFCNSLAGQKQQDQQTSPQQEPKVNADSSSQTEPQASVDNSAKVTPEDSEQPLSPESKSIQK